MEEKGNQDSLILKKTQQSKTGENSPKINNIQENDSDQLLEVNEKISEDLLTNSQKSLISSQKKTNQNQKLLQKQKPQKTLETELVPFQQITTEKHKQKEEITIQQPTHYYQSQFQNLEFNASLAAVEFETVPMKTPQQQQEDESDSNSSSSDDSDILVQGHKIEHKSKRKPSIEEDEDEDLQILEESSKGNQIQPLQMRINQMENSTQQNITKGYLKLKQKYSQTIKQDDSKKLKKEKLNQKLNKLLIVNKIVSDEPDEPLPEQDLKPLKEKVQNKKAKIQDRQKQKQLKKEKFFDKLCSIRNYYRIIIHLLIVAILIYFLVFYQQITYDLGQSTFTLKDDQQFIVKSQNCLLTFHEQSSENQMKIEYFINKQSQAKIKGKKLSKNIDFVQNENGFEIHAYSPFDDIKYCYINIFWPSEIKNFSKFNLECSKNEECYLTYKGQMRNFGDISFTSKGDKATVSANFQNIQYNTFDFDIENQGLLYLQNVIAKGQANINMKFGEVIIQSQNDFQIDFYNPFQAVCLNGPKVTEISNSGKCDISNESANSGVISSSSSQQPYKNANDYDNWVGDDGEIQTRLPGCQGSYSICASSACASNLPLFKVEIQYSGNIYANFVENLGYPPDYDLETLSFKGDYQLFEGQVFQNGLNYSDYILTDIENYYKSAVPETEPIWVIDLGNKFAQLSTQSLWVKSTNPAFAQMRPWWLASLSFSLLVTQTTKLEGFLQPGFCPYSTSMTIDQYWEIKQFIKETLPLSGNTTDRSSVTFVQPNEKEDPQEYYLFDEGTKLFDLGERNSFETWFDVVSQKNGGKVLDSYDQSDNQLIMYSLILSFIVSFLFALIAIYLLYTVALPLITEEVLNISRQYKQFTDTIQKNNEAQQKKEKVQSQGAEGVSFFINEKVETTKKKPKQPSQFAILDYRKYLEIRKMQKSYQSFFELLFQKSTEEIESQLLKGAVQAEDFLEIKEKTLKDLYEKFCYLNHFVEARLSDKKVVQYLKQKYNYKFVPDHAANQLFLKIAKRRKIQLFSSEQLKQGNSLENFLKINYEITGRESDDVWVEQLHQEYTDFCAENRLVLQNFRAKDVQQKYKLELTTKSQLKLVMDKAQQEQETEENDENFNNKEEQKSFQIEDFANEEQKLIKGQKLNQDEQNQRPTQKLVKNGKYLIRKDFLQHHFNLMADPIAYSDKHLRQLSRRQILKNELYQKVIKFIKKREVIPFTEQEQVFLKTHYTQWWIFVDIIVVVQQFVQNLVLILPLLLFILFTETSYAPYSMNHPVNQFAESNLKWSLVYIPLYIENCSPFIIYYLIIIGIFIIIQIISDLLIYFKAKQPFDRTLQKNTTSTKFQYVYTFQMIIVSVLLFCIITYITMNILWLMLGAIINPNFFLVYSTSAVTLVTFVTSKAQQFNQIYSGGIETIKQFLQKELNSRVSGIMNIIEAEKNSLFSKVENSLDSVKNTVVDVADNIGLGNEANALVSEINQNFKSLDKLKAEDLDPNNIMKKVAEQEAKIKQKLFQKMTEELGQLGIPENLSDGLYKLIILNDKINSKKIITKEIGRITENKVPELLINWIIDIVQQDKSQINMQNLQKEVLQIITEIMLQNILEDDENNLKEKIRSVILTAVELIKNIQDNDNTGFINIFKQILPLIPFGKNFDWTTNKQAKFIQKLMEIIMKVLTFKTDIKELTEIIQQVIDVSGLPDELGLFLTMIATQKDNKIIQYKEIKLQTYDEIRNFIQEKVLKKSLQFQNDGKWSKYLSTFFTFLLKFVRADFDFKYEITFVYEQIFEDFMQKQVNKTEDAFKQWLEDNKEQKQKTIEFLNDLINILQITFKKTENINEIIQTLASETNFDLMHIRGIIACSTVSACKNLKSLQGDHFHSRQKTLIEDNHFLADLSKAFGLPQAFILGFIDVFHDKNDIKYDQDPVEDQYMQNFYQFLFDTLKAKDTIQQYLIRQLFEGLKSRTAFEFLEQMQALLQQPVIKKYLKKQYKNEKQVIIKTISQLMNEGQPEQLQDFISKSFINLMLPQIEEYLNELNKYSQKNPIQIQKDNITIKNLEEQMTFQEQIEELLKIIKQSGGNGKTSIYQLKSAKSQKKALFEIVIQFFCEIGLTSNYANCLSSLYKVCYLKVDQTGFGHLDRFNLISDCAKKLKISHQVLDQIISFQDISQQSSKDNIIKFYQNNIDLMPQYEKDTEKISKQCYYVLQTIQQVNKVNTETMAQQFQLNGANNFGSNLLPVVQKFVGKEELFNVLLSDKLSLNKEQLSKICFKFLNFIAEQDKNINKQDIEDFQNTFYYFLYLFENFNYENLKIFFKDSINNPKDIKNINQLLNLFKIQIKGTKPSFLQFLKIIILNQENPNEQDKLLEFILDLLASISIPQLQQKQYSPGLYAQNFYNFVPNLQCLFSNDALKYQQLTDKICKQMFKFEAISTLQLETIFSLYTENPQLDEAQALLNINSNLLEVSHGMQQLICGKNKQKAINQFTKYQGYIKMCLKGEVNTEELEMLLKIAYKTFKTKDLELFLKLFQFEGDNQIKDLRGLFAFLLPTDKINYQNEPQKQKDYFQNFFYKREFYKKYLQNFQSYQNQNQNSNSNLNQNQNQSQSQNQKTPKINYIPPAEIFSVLEFSSNLFKGKFANIEYQFQQQQIIQDLKIFGSSPFIRYALYGIVGYLNFNQIIKDTSSLKKLFSSYKNNQEIVKNDLQGALYYLSKSMLKKGHFFSENSLIISTFLEKASTITQKFKNKNISNLDPKTKTQQLFYLISHQLSYSSKIKIIEQNQINLIENYFKNMVAQNFSEFLNKDNKVQPVYDLIEEQKQIIMKNLQLDPEQQILVDSISENLDQQQLIVIIFMTTLQSLKQQLKKYKILLKDPEFHQSELQKALICKFILDLDLLLSSISKFYGDESQEQLKFFRKNPTLKTLAFIYFKDTEIVEELFQNLLKYVIPSNVYCYLETQQSNYKDFEIIYKNSRSIDQNSDTELFTSSLKNFFKNYNSIYANENRFKIYDYLVEDVQQEEEIAEINQSEQNQKKQKKKKNPQKEQQMLENIKNYKFINISDLQEIAKKEQKMQIETQQLIKQVSGNLVYSFLNNDLKIADFLQEVQNNIQGVIGGEKIKQCIELILKITSNHCQGCGFTFMKDLVKAIPNLKSNIINLEIFLETMFIPDKDEQQIKKFIQIFIDPSFINQFMGIFLINLMKNQKFDLKKYAELEAITLVQQKYGGTLNEQQMNKQIKIYKQVLYDQILENSINSITQNIQIPAQQKRIIQNILKGLSGNIYSWVILLLNDMNIFSLCSPQEKEIGEYFVQKLFAIIQNYKYYNGSTIFNTTDFNNQASEDLYSCLKLAQQKAQNSKKIELIEELILFESKSLPTLSNFPTPQALQPLKSILNTFLLSEQNLKLPSSIAQIFENLSKTNFISQKHNGHLQQILHLFNYEQLITFLNRPENFHEQLQKMNKKNQNQKKNLNNHSQIPEPIAKLFQIILEKKIKNQTQKQLFMQLFDFVFVFNLKDPLLSIGQKMLQYYNTSNNGNNQQIVNTFGIISLSLFSNFQKITTEQSQIFILYMFNILGLIETNQFQKEINTYKIQENAEKLLEFNGNVQKSKILNGISFIGTCSKAIDKNKAQKYLQNFIMNNIVKKGGPLIKQKENQAEDDKQKIQAIGQLFLCMFVQFSDFFRNDQDKIIEIIQKAEFTIKEFAQEKIDFFQITCDIIFVSFDILKNKNILSTKQVLEKYSNNFHRYFKMLNNITSSFLSEGDEELKFFIDFLIDSLEKFIFTDTTNLKEELITQFAQNIGTLFKRIIFQSLNTKQNKEISYFNNDQTSFNTYKKALREYTKLETTYHQKKLQINALKLNLQETSLQKNQHTQNLNTFYQRYGQLDPTKLFKNGPEEIPNPSLNPNLNPNVNPNVNPNINPNANPNVNPNPQKISKAKQNLNKYSAHLNQISHLSFYQKYLSQLEKETQNIENQQIKTNFTQVIDKFKIQLQELKQFFDQKEVKNFSLNLNLDDSFLPEKDKSDANLLQQQQNELISQLEEIVNEIIFNFKINFYFINQFDPDVYEKIQDTSFIQQLEFQIFYGIQIFDAKQQLRNLEIFAEKAQLKITNLVQKQLNSEAKKIEKLKNLAKLDPKIDKILSKTDFIIQKIVQIQKIYAQKLSPLIEDFDINGFDFAIFINKFVPEIVQLANFDPDSSQANVFIQNVTNSIICLINCQFDQIHDDLFQVMNFNKQQITAIRSILLLFQSQGKQPLELLESKKNETLGFINMKMNDPSFNQFNKIKEKIEEQGLQPREIFKLADLDGGGTLDMREFQLYFKKIGIELSEHRVNEIFAQAKKASPQIQQSSEQHLDEEEFIKAYEYVLSYSMILTLEKMGITRTKLTIILIYLVVILLLIFLFIFVGVAAFAIPGAFGAMINSLFPIMGGTGLSKANSSKSEKKKDFTKIKETIKESLATIQNTDI